MGRIPGIFIESGKDFAADFSFWMGFLLVKIIFSTHFSIGSHSIKSNPSIQMKIAVTHLDDSVSPSTDKYSSVFRVPIKAERRALRVVCVCVCVCVYV